MTTTASKKYETRSVKTIRGMEARTRSKIEKEGWEFVSQTQGSMRSELTFRRPKPETPWKLIVIGGGLLAVLVFALIIGNAFGGEDNSSKGADNLQSPARSHIAQTEASATSGKPSPTEPEVTAITVDELLEKLNSSKMGGIKVGDQFLVTGELFMSDLWMTGATGEFSVMLKAQGGAQDLSVFVKESDAAGWHDGTKVQMIVEMGEATINGETSDGWLRALSVKLVQ